MARSSTTAGPGNQLALRHGGRSRIAVEKRASEVREELAALLTAHLDLSPADQPLVDLAVDVTTKLRLMSDFFDRTSGGSLIDLRGRPRSAANLYLALMRQAVACCDRLGIGPAARIQLLGGNTSAAKVRHQRAAEEAQREIIELYGPKESA